MAKVIWDYPVTNPFGGEHKGEDRAAPVGTPVPVNSVSIGLTGNTGLSTGPHLHVHRYNKDHVAISPRGGGKTLANATVAEIQTVDKGANGKFVKVTSGSETWYYLHLSKVNVKVGQKLGGNDMYKGHSAKYWYEKYQASHTNSVKRRTALEAIRATVNKVLGKE